LNCDPPDFCLLSSWDYRYETPAPGTKVFFNEEQEDHTGPVWGWGPVGDGGHKELMNEREYGDVLCIHI
jgi:hypothetical protein